MDPDELLEKVRHRPFEPFRIFVSDGTAYEVAHPEQIIVGRRSSHVGIPGNLESPFQRIAIVASVDITGIEPLDGKKRKRASKRRP